MQGSQTQWKSILLRMKKNKDEKLESIMEIVLD